MSEPKRIRIISDGTPKGTHVFDASGAELTSMISKVEWCVESDGAAVANITFPFASVDVVGDAK